MVFSKKVIITGAILTLLAGTSVFADEIAQVTGLQDVQATQDVQNQEDVKATAEQDVSATTDENTDGKTEVETNVQTGENTSVTAEGTAVKATGLNNALQHVTNENAKQHIQANIDRQNARNGQAEAETSTSGSTETASTETSTQTNVNKTNGTAKAQQHVTNENAKAHIQGK